jgi:hypothetical protein
VPMTRDIPRYRFRRGAPSVGCCPLPTDLGCEMESAPSGDGLARVRSRRCRRGGRVRRILAGCIALTVLLALMLAIGGGYPWSELMP